MAQDQEPRKIDTCQGAMKLGSEKRRPDLRGEITIPGSSPWGILRSTAPHYMWEEVRNTKGRSGR